MQKILNLTGVSVLAIMTVNGVNAAGYTCEELIEYTSCNAGYYLNDGGDACPSGHTYYLNGVCIEEANMTVADYFATQAECEAAWTGISGEDYMWYTGPVCVSEGDEFGYEREISAPNESAGKTCNECPAGSYCTGEKNAPTTCPAGSYCATVGLKEPTGLCSVGAYSTGGATACTTCPASDLTDANGNVVSVTTASTGATSSSACFVAKGTEFKDVKGIYKYTDNCQYGNYPEYSALVISSEDECEARGWSVETDGCYVYDDGSVVPRTEDACNAADADWSGNSCDCMYYWGFRWEEPGITCMP